MYSSGGKRNAKAKQCVKCGGKVRFPLPPLLSAGSLTRPVFSHQGSIMVNRLVSIF